MKLADIPVYTPDDWARERATDTQGTPLACPNCARTEWYHPLGIPPDTGAQRKYRACKMCGCWQEADGESLAYRCALTAHTCTQAIKQNAQCANCEVWGPLGQHRCRRALTSPELDQFACKHCGVILTRAHVIPWPVTAE